MILVDTSVWIDHLRHGDPELASRLERGRVVAHPFVIGELALGQMNRRSEILATLRQLPRASVASADEILQFIERNELSGFGIGYVDVHLLAATRLTPEAWLWTRDKRLAEVAARLGVAA